MSGLFDEGGKLALCANLVDFFRGYIAEIDIAFRIAGRSLGELEAGEQLGDLARWADAGIGTLS